MVDKYNVVVNDKDSLKNILIIAGIHGNEIGTISLAYDLIHTISHTKKEELQTLFPDIREITILPVANYEAMRSCKRDIVHTTNDLNRGWFTDRYATIRTDILDEIEKADVVIDMHSSENCTELLYINSNSDHSICRKMIGFAQYIGVDYAVTHSNNDTIKDFTNSTPGKIGITWEQKGLNRVYPEVNNRAHSKIMNILKYIGKIDSHIYYDDIYNCITLANNIEGLFKPVLQVSNDITRGCIIGSIIDMKTGEVIENIVSYVTGTIISMSYSKYAKSGEVSILIQPKKERDINEEA